MNIFSPAMLSTWAGQCTVYGQNLLKPFRGSRLNAPTHFNTLISLESYAQNPGAPIRNFTVFILGQKGITNHEKQSLEDQET
jgi:hypothetical protein